ncbi:hypothetical protein ATY41_11660 [Leifsonia xyli subsp. xyli]|uniref:Integral membrane protein n=2 Tax=Leifsonia xyli subsp. xyli TaxID=59736 RepID=Q6AGI9_LEIXX|nr:DUF4129 domain-containing protein [Leifsonia xyli]AAT88506.1 integral membrane protein [Leifsonia xyli subsp. xyli str. CTCB07]ODA89927.1 hypothetical protein ATY41_11660 [Leifsonia xyli subsp. xyli]
MRSDIPVDPSSPDAHDWVHQELVKPEYQAAKPTWFDLVWKAIGDGLASLFQGPGGDAGPVLLVVIVLIVAGIVVAAFFVFGRPRVNRQAAASHHAVLGGDDARTAQELRSAAGAAAHAGDWALAIEERFRTLAVGLDERTLVSLSPGTTATEFAARATAAAPEEAEALREASRAFDDVRYLDRPGSEPGYQLLVALDQRLQTRRAAPPAVLT